MTSYLQEAAARIASGVTEEQARVALHDRLVRRAEQYELAAKVAMYSANRAYCEAEAAKLRRRAGALGVNGEARS